MTRQNNQIQDKKIILVLDTSWLMEIGRYTFNPLTKMLEEKILNKGEDVEIWIHGRVLRELDGLKNVEDKSHQARVASRYLREALNAFKSRIKISDFGVLKPEKEFRDSITSEVDAIVLSLAEKAKKIGKVYLFTTDNNMKLLGENISVKIVEEVFTYTSPSQNQEMGGLVLLLAVLAVLTFPVGTFIFLIAYAFLQNEKKNTVSSLKKKRATYNKNTITIHNANYDLIDPNTSLCIPSDND